MTEKKIRLSGVEDIKLLCNAAVECPFDIDIISGNYILDAKSFMGIFSLQQKDALTVRVSADAEQAQPFFEKIAALCE